MYIATYIYFTNRYDHIAKDTVLPYQKFWGAVAPQPLVLMPIELNDNYPGSCLCLLQYWNGELYTIMLTVGVIILEHLASGVVLKLFRLAKSKLHQDLTIVHWRNEAGDWTQ